MNTSTKMLIWYADACGYKARDYSGRFMFGKYCLGYDVDNVEKFLVDVLDYGARSYLANGLTLDNLDNWQEFVRLLRRAQKDTMGLGVIVYFPDAAWDECVEVMDRAGIDHE